MTDLRVGKISPHRKDMTGMVFGKLTVLEAAGRKDGRLFWKCQCKCGAVVETNGKSLRRGESMSCGCASKTNQFCQRPEYCTWVKMRSRCYEPRDISYKNYGARGIAVCDRWLGKGGFGNFIADMGPRPTRRHTLDRVDNDKEYSPENCRWATWAEQVRNRRSTRFYTFQNEIKTLPEWADHLGIPIDVIRGRLNKCGWSVERALSTPRMTRSEAVKLSHRVSRHNKPTRPT